MIEVFKTNVRTQSVARQLVREISNLDQTYTANFDLSDRDRILRVVCRHGMLQVPAIVSLVNSFGFDAEVLEDK